MAGIRTLTSVMLLLSGSAYAAPLQDAAEAPAPQPEPTTTAPAAPAPAPAAPAAPAPAAPAKLDFDTWRSLPKELPYEPGMTIPAGYDHKKKVRLAPVIAGSTMLGVSWLASAAAAAIDQDVSSVADVTGLYIPVVGPFVVIGTQFADDDLAAAEFVALGFDGAVQVAGAALLLWGVIDRKEILRRKPFGVAGGSVLPTHDGVKVAVSGHF